MFNSRRLLYLGVVVFLFCMINGCRKPFEEKQPKPSQSTARSGSAKLTIDVEDILAGLPKTAMYNLIKDKKVNLYLGRAQWEYTPSGLTVRIPTSETNYNYLYATKRYDAPEKTNVYAVRYWPGEGSSDADFTGVTEWVDFQDWKVYSVKMEANTIISYMEPMPIASPGWEQTKMAYGHFQINNGRMTGIDDCIIAHPDGNGGFATMNTDCPPPVNGDGKNWLTRLLDNLGDWLEGLFGGDGGSNSGQPGDGRGNGYGGTHNPYGDMGHYYNNTLDIGQYPPAGGSMGGGNPDDPGGPNPGDGPIMFEGSDIGLNAQTYLINDPNVFTVMTALNLNGTQGRWLQNNLDKNSSILTFLLQFDPTLTPDQKADVARDHLSMMMENSDYLNWINSLTGNWWDRDQKGFIKARIIQMDVYTKIHPFGALDCNDINGIDAHWTNWQTLGNYQIPASVFQRIADLRNQYPSRYTASSFYIQDIADAQGAIVNLDFFALHINTLPFDSYGYTRMTSEQFLDFFRQNIDLIDNLGDNTATIYNHYNDPGYLNDYTRFHVGYESSIGSLAHFHNPAAMAGYLVYNDGTVIESGFDQSTDHKWFMYTTMKAPLDGEHPVSGNRRFGILPDAINGGYLFYVRGVDRTTDNFTTMVNYLTNTVFEGADQLWNSEIKGVQNYIQQHGGAAIPYSTGGTIKRRVDWEGAVGRFLNGEINFQTLKSINNCP